MTLRFPRRYGIGTTGVLFEMAERIDRARLTR